MLCLFCISVSFTQADGNKPAWRNLKLHSSVIEEAYLRTTAKDDRASKDKGESKEKEYSDHDDDDDEVHEKSKSAAKSAPASKSKTAKNTYDKAFNANSSHAPSPVPPKDDSANEEKYTQAKKPKGCRRLSKDSSKRKQSSPKRKKVGKYHDDDTADGKSENDHDDADKDDDKVKMEHDDDNGEKGRPKSKGYSYDDDDDEGEKGEKLDDKYDECDDDPTGTFRMGDTPTTKAQHAFPRPTGNQSSISSDPVDGRRY